MLPGKNNAMKKKIDSNQAKRDYRLRISDDLIWGVHPVLEALKSQSEKLSEIVLLKERKGGRHQDIIDLAREGRIKLHFVSSLRLTGPEAAQVRHQGVVARLSQTALLPFETLLEKFSSQIAQGLKPRLMVCDTLHDPHNLGAVIRSAYGGGMSGVIITKDRSAQPGGIAAKSSAGAFSHIDICQVTNLVSTLKKLKEAGAWVFGAVKSRESQSIYDTDFCLPSCLIVGNEGAGIRPLVQKQCDFLVSIPMVGQLDSLNLSVAAGVIIFEMLRQNSDQAQGDR